MALKIIGYVIAASLVFCVYFILRKHAALRDSDQFQGTVIGHVPHHGSKGTNYALRVEYQDAHEQKVAFEASGASRPPARPIGAPVIVFQHRDGSKPDVLLFESTYLGLWIWLCVGLCVVGCLSAPAVLNAVYRQP